MLSPLSRQRRTACNARRVEGEFLVDKDTLLTHRYDGSVGMWRIGVDDWLRDLCALGGELTGAERQRYLGDVQIGSVCGE